MKSHFTFILIFLLFFCTLPIISIAQDMEHYIHNPSFEDFPRKGGYYNSVLQAQRNNIRGWFDCGILEFPENTAPDIHSAESEFWDVRHTPSEGQSFLSLTVREDSSWEGVSQELIRQLSEDRCYSFTLDMCKSTTYESGVKGIKRKIYSFGETVVLKIWGGNRNCDKLELLYESPPVANLKWQPYKVNIQPKQDMAFITLQAYYVDRSKPYNGNILIDNITEFTVTNCEEE
jgi:hypothetical protein